MKHKKTAFLFSGQGSQFTGMGADIFADFEDSRRVYNMLPENLRNIAFYGDIDALSLTENLQPIMVAHQLAILDILLKNGILPDASAGISLGEYSALAAVGAISAEDAIKLVAVRGRAMAAAARGIDSSMCVVAGADEEIIRRELENAAEAGFGAAYVSNINSPKQIVVSGESGAVNAAQKRLRELGARIIPLRVSGPFHTPYMDSAADELALQAESIHWKRAQKPLYTNFSGKPLETDTTDREQLRQIYRKNLINQMRSAVRLYECLKNMVDAGVERFVEIGCGSTACSIIKKEFPDAIVYSISDSASLAEFIGRRAAESEENK